MFVDFNSFFASVEQVLQPRLRDRPVVVVPIMADTTCCIAASRQAKSHGIKTGTPVHEARRLCPGLQVVEARPEYYVRCHKKMNAVIEDCGISAEVESIDEVHCPLWGEWMEMESAKALARRVKEAIAREISPLLTCSIGLAPNRFLAKTASDMQKPDGFVTITPEDLPHCLYPLQLRDLYGIGPRMEVRLRAHGIESVKMLCAASRPALRAVWGGIEGERFHAALHGQPTFHRSTTVRTLGHSHILPPELRHEPGARSVLHRLTQKAAMRLRSLGYLAGGMNVYIRSTGQRGEWSEEIRFADTQDTIEFLHALDLLWQRRPDHACDALLGVGMTLLSLKEEANATLPLFERDCHERHTALLAAVDRLNIKEGKNTVYFGGAHGALQYTPMRIAFTRIPDPDTER